MRKLLNILLFLFPFIASADYPRPWQFGFQEAASPVMEALESFHNHLLLICFAVAGLVCALLLYTCLRYNKKMNPVPSKCAHNTFIEIIWTVIPVIILVVIAFPSLHNLYFAEKVEDADFSIKVVGRQWYWEYNYPDHGGFSFESRLIPDANIQEGQKRLLDVDNPLVLPVGKKIKVLITGGDVIHSWGVSSLGVKKDAVPGRTNETWFLINKEGTYYGHCYELCGIDHGFMPIKIIAVNEDDFNKWIETAKTQFSSLPYEFNFSEK